MIKYIKLIDGDEIIGDVDDDVDGPKKTHIIIYNPLQISLKESEDGKSNIIMDKYLIYTAGNNIKLPMSSVVYAANVSQDIYELYYVSLEFIQKRVDGAISTSIHNTTNLLKLALSGSDGVVNPEFDGPMSSTVH